MTYSTLGAAGEFLEYPTNKIVAVFADWAQARAVIERLAADGFSEKQIGVLHGPDGAKRLDASGEHHGVFAQISRFFQRFADMDDKHTQRHEQELLAGHVLVHVEAPEEVARTRVFELMRANGGYFINYYGKWQIENLAV